MSFAGVGNEPANDDPMRVRVPAHEIKANKINIYDLGDIDKYQLSKYKNVNA